MPLIERFISRRGGRESASAIPNGVTVGPITTFPLIMTELFGFERVSKRGAVVRQLSGRLGGI